MSDTADKIEKSAEELRRVSTQINQGLGSILDMLDNISAEANSMGSSASPNSPGEKELLTVLNMVRNELSSLTQMGDEFGTRVASFEHQFVELHDKFEKTREVALMDPLTGIANRRKFEAELERYLGAVLDLNGKLCVLISDVDHFKTFNDTYGHHVGDNILKLVAKTYVGKLGHHALPARWGGDEFAVILPGSDLKQAKKTAEDIMASLTKRDLVNKVSGEKLGRATLSIGITSYRAGDTPKTFMQRADQALYLAKKKGRNRIETD